MSVPGGMTNSVEGRGFSDLEPFFKMMAHDGRFVLTREGRQSELLQRSFGDVILNRADGLVWCVEVKVETSDYYGNLFIEDWSNRCFDPRLRRDGWMRTIGSDILLYYFLAQKKLFSVDFKRLYVWCFGERGVKGRLYDFEQKTQRKYDQQNETVGYVVPIEVIRKEVGLNEYRANDDGTFVCVTQVNSETVGP